MVQRRAGSRKLLVASIGVATVTYVAVSCGGTVTSTGTGNDAGTAKDGSFADHVDEFPVANLVAPPDSSFADTVDEAPIANLVAPPDGSFGDAVPPDSSFLDTIDEFPVANLVAPPLDAGQGHDGGTGVGG